MQRYFFDFNPFEKEISILNDDFHHIKNVMRMKVGEKIYVTNNACLFIAQITSFTNESVICELIEEVKDLSELPFHIVIAQGMPKADKFEYIIQKTTELGVKEIIPVLSSRSLVKIDAKTEDKKISRYQKIAKEASEQSHRLRVPQVNSFMTFQEFVQYSTSFTHKLVAYEASTEEDMYNFKTILKNIKENESIIVFVGPEGGISEKELMHLKDHGFLVISLGNRILRTETAPLFIMSAIIYELELKG